MQLLIRVNVAPAATPRPRATTAGGKKRSYTPLTVGKGAGRRTHPAVVLKQAIAAEARRLHRGEPLDGPLRVDVLLVFPRPKSRPKKLGSGRYPHTSRPDRDNCDKTVLDALTGIVWVDDCQVCAGGIRKVVAAVGEKAHVEITVETL